MIERIPASGSCSRCQRGLGLTVDLISRNGGSIHVEDEPGWSKAVVIRLQRAEEA